MDISRINKAVAQALNEWADDVMPEIVDATPMDTRKLRSSITYERATDNNPVVTFISRGHIAVNKKGKSYNVTQHETQYKHYTTEGTGPYFMTKPTQKALPDLARRIKEALKNGG